MELRLVTTSSEFDELKPEWIRLVESNENCSIFQSWEWQRSWWKYYGNNKVLQIIVVSENGKIVGILPLYIERKKLLGLFNVNVLRLIGAGGDTSPDYLGMLSDPKYTLASCHMISDYIITRKRKWDVIMLADIASENVLLKCLSSKSKSRDFKYGLKTFATIQYIDLPGSWEEYFSSKSKSKRKSFRYARNSFEKLDGFRFFVWEDKKNLDKIVDKLIELHHMRWKGRAEQYSFRTKNYNNFHRELIKKLFNRDAIRLYCMEVDGEIMAIEYCYRWNNAIFNFQGGFNPAYEKKSPGTAIFSYIIEDTINEGSKIFDMLKGDYPYKYSLSNNERKTSIVTVYQKNIRGFLYRLRFKHISDIKKQFVRLKNKEYSKAFAVFLR